MNDMANGIFVTPEKTRLQLEDALLKIETGDLLNVVKQYEIWKKTSEFTLVYTIAQEIWQEILEIEEGNKIYGPLKVYDAIARELARRLVLETL